MKAIPYILSLPPVEQRAYMKEVPTTALVSLRFAHLWCTITGEWPEATLKALRYAVSTGGIRNEGRTLNLRTGKLCPTKKRVQVRLFAVRNYIARKGLK